MEPINHIGNWITNEAISEKRNIVIEFIGENEKEMSQVSGAMKAKGYYLNLRYIDLDPKLCHERHVKAVNEDPNYISTYIFKDLHRN